MLPRRDQQIRSFVPLKIFVFVQPPALLCVGVFQEFHEPAAGLTVIGQSSSSTAADNSALSAVKMPTSVVRANFFSRSASVNCLHCDRVSSSIGVGPST